MGAASFLGRWAVRRHWRSSLALILLVGLGAGAATGAAMGTRRTSTAFSRLLAVLEPSDVVLSPPFDEPLTSADEAKVEAMDEVRDLRRVWGFGLVARTADGLPDLEGDGWGTTGSPDGAYPYRGDRPRLVEGRFPAPGSATDVIVNRVAARQGGLNVGDTIRAMVFDVSAVSALEEPFSEAEKRALVHRYFTPVDLRVSGVYEQIEELAGRAESADDPGVIVTPAFTRTHRNRLSYRALGVTLAPGVTQEKFLAAVDRTLGRRGFDVVTSRRDITDAVDRSVTPVVSALWILAGLLAIATVLVAGQGLARSTRAEVAESGPVGALGMTREERVAAAMPRAVCIAVGAAAVSLVVGYLSSGLFPLAPVERADPVSGLRADWLLLLASAAAVIAVTLTGTAVAAWRATASMRAVPDDRPGLVDAMGRSGLPAPMVSGFRLALRPSGVDALVPASLVLAGAVVAIAVVVGAVVFGSSLDRLVHTPRMYGWTWDAMVFDPVEAGTGASTRLDHDPDVRAVTAVRSQTVTVNGQSVLAAGFEPLRGDILPTITDGRHPVDADEAALGGRTLRRLGVHLGETVDVAGGDRPPHRFRVVGRAILPVVSPDLSSGSNAGEGLVLGKAGFEAVAGRVRPSTYFVDLADGGRGVRGLKSSYGSGLVFGPQQPPDIRNYRRIRSVPLALAGLVGVMGAGVLMLGLTSAVRRRRRDLAVMRTLGFDRRQVRWTVAWLATAVVLPAIVIGLPAGLVVGRQAWRMLADRLAVPAESEVSVVMLVATALVALVLANAAAAVAEMRAARRSPGVSLRAE